MDLVSCPYCGGVHSRGEVCGKRRRYGRQQSTEENRFRHGNAWTAKSIQIRNRDRGLCVYCLMHDNVINNTGIEVHHIIPLRESRDLRLDDENLISLCREHHEQAEKGEIKRQVLIKYVREQEEEFKNDTLIL